MQPFDQTMSRVDIDYLAWQAEAQLLSPEEMQDDAVVIETTALTAPVSEFQIETSSDVQQLNPEIKNEVLFAFDSSDINSAYFQSLNETALEMQRSKGNQQTLWQVVGYADKQGNTLYNIELAKQRAQAVAQYLVAKGVAEDKLSILSLGDSNAKNQSAMTEHRQQRRVEIHPYQAEITLLATQLQQQKHQLKKQQIARRVAQKLLNEVVAIEGHAVLDEQENEFADDFALPTKNAITTAMDHRG
ncbi:OmpA family protein [Psychromonas sp. MME2]|uniref:OmpA family protein n=1 Tax=Psychromonas sp. MME2 TaxID=3231033 RepID=UPI00339CC263